MPFVVCHYHIVWATKNRAEWLTTEVEECIFASIHETSKTLNSPLLAINACVNHVHVAASIGTHIATRDYIGRIKGASSRLVNKRFAHFNGQFRWQKSYGLLTFGQLNLPVVLEYIKNQKQHHAFNTIMPYLENSGETVEDAETD